jgi:hypothetical protein
MSHIRNARVRMEIVELIDMGIRGTAFPHDFIGADLGLVRIVSRGVWFNTVTLLIELGEWPRKLRLSADILRNESGVKLMKVWLAATVPIAVKLSLRAV